VTGLRVEDLYKNAFLDIQKEWIEEQSKITENPATQISVRINTFLIIYILNICLTVEFWLSKLV
jgi:hypothetical protein